MTPFVGKNLMDALYKTNNMEIQNYSQYGIIMAIDLRGYTNFTQSHDLNTVRAVMTEYHAICSRILGQNEGYLHKTIGDGIIASFGVMEKEEDLSDVIGINDAIKTARQNRKSDLLKKSNNAFEKVLIEFENIKEKFKIKADLVVGAGIAYGEIELLIRGDAKFRQELDIDGESIIRAKRLESYSKLLNSKVDKDSSFLVISPELNEACKSINSIKIWLTNTNELAVRDYHEIKSVLYRQWKHNRARTSIKEVA
jgi:class 3 adenylate cyclase